MPHLPLVLSSLSSSAGRSDWSSLESIDVSLQQRHLSRVIDSFRFESLMASSPTPPFKALAPSSSLPHAGDWLNATPCPSLGLSFYDWEFCVCLKYWLGVQMVEEGSSCCICGVSSDLYGDHHVTCRGNGDMISRHNILRDVIFTTCRTAALSLPGRKCHL